MIKPPFGTKMKTYEIKCGKCDITETMMFVKAGWRWRHMPEAGNERNAFKPITGTLGDKPPKTCPKCEGKVTVEELRIWR